MLRPLRLLRLVTVLAVFQRIGGTRLVGRVALYVSVSTVMLIFVGSLAMLSVERHQPGATITSYGDALWWAVVTMTTVGYGDMYPVSAEGRIIAVALMVGGIALLGVVTATVATWLIQKVSEQDEASQAATRAQVRELTEEVRALRASLLPADPVVVRRRRHPPHLDIRRDGLTSVIPAGPCRGGLTSRFLTGQACWARSYPGPTFALRLLFPIALGSNSPHLDDPGTPIPRYRAPARHGLTQVVTQA